MNAKLLRLRICSYLSLKFNSNFLWTYDNCCPNSLKPSFPTHSLQIYCLRLIGSTYFTLKFGSQIETLQLALSVGKTLCISECNGPIWKDQVSTRRIHSRQSLQILNYDMAFSILNVNGIERNIEGVVCVPLIRVKATLEEEVMYPKGKFMT